jgi:hypothetical protein
VERSLLDHKFRITNSRRLIVSCSARYRSSQLISGIRGSMEPAFYRGDILFLTNPAHTPYEVGDITVYKMSASHRLTRSRADVG